MDDLLDRFDRQLRRRPPWPDVVVEDRIARVDGPGWRGVLWSDLDEATADRAIAAEVARFAGRGRWEWKLYSYDAPSDLAERLLAAGFVAEDEETLLVGEIAALPRAAPMPDGVRLVDVEDEAGIAAFLHVGEDVFGDHDIAFGEQLLGDIRAGRSAAVVAVAGDRPISSGRIEFYDGTDFAGLYGGATVADWRRRGIFRAVVAHRAGLARARGVRYLQTDASDDSRPIFLRLGFRAIATTTPYILSGSRYVRDTGSGRGVSGSRPEN